MFPGLFKSLYGSSRKAVRFYHGFVESAGRSSVRDYNLGFEPARLNKLKKND